MQSVVIFGAGIAGLSAAHELIQLGYAQRTQQRVLVRPLGDAPCGKRRKVFLGDTADPDGI